MPLPYNKNDLNPTYLENIQNALDAGLTVEVVISPRRCRTVDEDVQFLGRSLKGKPIDRFWISFEYLDSECSWSHYTSKQNC